MKANQPPLAIAKAMKLLIHTTLSFVLLSHHQPMFIEALTFALVPKRMNTTFWHRAELGCQDAAESLNVTCVFTGPSSNPDQVLDPMEQANIFSDLVVNETIDGIAVSVADIEIMSPLIDKAVEAGKVVTTWDSDAPNSKRFAYIGTNNTFFGIQIAKLLKQLRPNGGTFGVMSVQDGGNIAARDTAFRRELLENSNNVWTEVEGSPSDSRSIEQALNDTENFANLSPTGIALMLEGPMRHTAQWEALVERHEEQDIVYVSGDASLNQLDLLSRRKCHGLVGQLPHEMGFLSIQVLDKLVRGETIESEVIGTNVVTHIQVPLVLPKLVVDHNRIGDLAVVGYILFALVAVSAIGFSGWTFYCRKLHVVKASQPPFLIMVAVGILIMASTIIPLSFDDTQFTVGSTGICMSIPWLCYTGFTFTFAALYSKTRRINRVFHSGEAFTRVKVKPHHVVIPFAILLTLNMIVLICWTLLDPLTFQRVNHAGLDGWNRVISTYGTCRSNHGVRFFVPLTAINLVVLLIANWQVYEARKIKSEFSESKYIGLAMASLLQCGLMGIPVLFVVREQPEAFYLIVVFMIFIVCMGVLLLVFAPKIVLQETYSRSTPEERRRMIMESVQESQESRATPVVQQPKATTSYSLGLSTVAESTERCVTQETTNSQGDV